MELLERIGVFDDVQSGKVMVLGAGCPAAYMAVRFPEKISECFLYDSIALHGHRFCPLLSSGGAYATPLRAATTREDFAEHCQGFTAMGAHSSDEAKCRALWDVVCGGGDWMPPLGSPAMRRFHEACQKHRSRAGCNMGNARFNLTPIKTISSPPTDWLQKLECP